MAQTNEVERSKTLSYTRADLTALRAYLSKIPIATIRAHYYNEDDLADEGIEHDSQIAHRLATLRDWLADRALEANPQISETLSQARAKSLWSRALVQYLIDQGEPDARPPVESDALIAWFRPHVVRRFAAENIRTLGQLRDYITLRGARWYQPIPGLGEGKARRIEAWLMRHSNALAAHPMAMALETPSHTSALVDLDPGEGITRFSLVPLERMRLPTAYSGEQGPNRNARLPMISARTDLDAIQAYLMRYADSPKTQRAYRKELERFLAWCVLVQRIPLSGVCVEDCEAYKAFLAEVPPEWTAPHRASRGNPAWRPFRGPLTLKSQVYAVNILRAFYEWLLRVRYLAGNPWGEVRNPRQPQGLPPLDTHKALPDALWEKLTDPAGFLAQACALLGEPLPGGMARTQARIFRAVLLLSGTTGLRREEVATALRRDFLPQEDGSGYAELAVLGKRLKWRTVVIPPIATAALAAHWEDLAQLEADTPVDPAEHHLISPVVIPGTHQSRIKHAQALAGYSPEGIYQVLHRGFTWLASLPEETTGLTPGEQQTLRQKTTHALRHTFGVRAAKNIPLNILQGLLGHTSLSTTTIYTQADRKQRLAAVTAHFSESAEAR